MNDFILTQEYIQFIDEFDTWEEAISVSAKPLLDTGKIQQSYIDSMIGSVKEHGPYIIIAPKIALPHARPETGSLQVGFSIMITKKPVIFDEVNQAKLFIALSCVDSETHLVMLQKIVGVLSDKKTQDQLMNTTDTDEVLNIFNSIS